jgi:protein-S-isoprenylcysteine O-methyltransferase Ste14
VLSPEQNAIVYLMFLNGILFLGLRFIAFTIVNYDSKESKRIGYALLTTVLLIAVIQQQYQAMIQLSFIDSSIRKILLGGGVAPVFLLSISYYRMKRFRLENASNKIHHSKN